MKQGKAKVKLSFAAWPIGDVSATTAELPIVEPDAIVNVEEEDR